ncbi:MAG: hypothetical protein JNN24_09375 [Hyphomicrobium zavarzinii]|uniref:hypothetical protein n=1 Tax=Hyphomicrobium zavarzinii TaxID=48292 RepID=UPI0012EBE04D|nr:hypothetical protein [Hyphomicrobium zavarzinii]MBL8845964.1 hypothetical protein [Hyphomicrobium zavarzinii]
MSKDPPRPTEYARDPEHTVLDQGTAFLSTALTGISEVSGWDKSIITALKTWCDDPRPAVTRRTSKEPDKFPELIDICRRIPECGPFFVKQLEINPSTLWRWSMGHSRPASYVANSVVSDLIDIICERLEHQRALAAGPEI